MFRFLHTSDLHIGKRFGNLPEDLRGRLREARHGVIARLAEQARTHGAGTVVLAGDTFDTETPTPAMLRQALASMRESGDLRWVILPGNHDSLLADDLWGAARVALPDNVLLALAAEPIELAEGVVVLPAPCTTRRPGRDLTEWMASAQTPEASLRIGLAHGPIQSFSEEGGASDVIAPDRVARADLDYLALGDWHGQMRVNERTWYAGTPEPDRFKHRTPGQALVVAVERHGAQPEVTPVETGRFDWRTVEFPVLTGAESLDLLDDMLPAAGARRQTLLRLVVSGRLRIADRAALSAAFEAVAPEFGHAELDTEALVTECEVADLDLIDQAGALRQAAEVLLAESTDETFSLDARTTANEALARLFSYCGAMRE